MTAHDILAAAQGHMKDRAATYDKPEGERSMGATVEAFKAVTGHQLTEEQGWLFMAILKAVRSQQGAYRQDSYEDGAAYFALAGETARQYRKRPVIRELYTEAAEARMDAVGHNGNTVEHYPADEWIPSNGKKPDLPDDTMVDVKFSGGGGAYGSRVQRWIWEHDGATDDITHYRIHQPE